MNTSRDDIGGFPPVTVPADEVSIPEDRLLTVRDLQYIFSIGRNHAYVLMNSKAFPTMQVGSRKYVSREALQKWIETYTGRQYIL